MTRLVSPSNRATAGQIDPFVKWVGGKRRLLPEIEKLVPSCFGNYFEPFLGGGALFFHLASTGRLAGRSILRDTNRELIDTYQAVREHPEEIIARLWAHASCHGSPHFRVVRELLQEPSFQELDPIERAAHFIYLTNASYWSAWTTTKKGAFRGSFSGADSLKILDPENLRSAAVCLRVAELGTGDFREIAEAPGPGDLVYLDPPYLTQAAEEVVGYTAPRFCREDQDDVVHLFQELAGKGTHVILSNSCESDVQEQLKDFVVRKVWRDRRSPEVLIASTSSTSL